MGLEELKGTKYSKYSIPYGIEKAKKLAYALMRMNGSNDATVAIDENLLNNPVVEDEESITMPDGAIVNGIFMNEDQPDVPEAEKASSKALRTTNEINSHMKRAVSRAGELKPIYELADTMSNAKGLFLKQACTTGILAA